MASAEHKLCRQGKHYRNITSTLAIFLMFRLCNLVLYVYLNGHFVYNLGNCWCAMFLVWNWFKNHQVVN